MLAVIDQGLISGSNFIVSVLLARWLRPDQYGAYALAFSIFVLAASVHQALLLLPMSVLGPALYRDRRQKYLGVMLWIHAVFSLPSIALGILTVVTDGGGLRSDMGAALLGVALATPCILLFWLIRSAFYLELSPGLAAVGALLYSALLAGGMIIVIRRGWLSPLAVFLLMTTASLAVSAFLLTRLKPTVKLTAGDPALREVWVRNWNYGRWELATGVVTWLGQNASYALAGAMLDMAKVGALKALTNLILPMSQMTVALRRLAQPYVSGISGQQGHSATKTSVRTITVLSAIGGLGYCVVVSLLCKPIFNLLYGGKFMEFAYLVPWLTLSFAIATGSDGFAVGLRAMQSPSSIFVINCTSGVVATLVGIPAVRLFDLPGLIGAGFLASVTMLGVGAFVFRRKMRAATVLERD